MSMVEWNVIFYNFLILLSEDSLLAIGERRYPRNGEIKKLVLANTTRERLFGNTSWRKNESMSKEKALTRSPISYSLSADDSGLINSAVSEVPFVFNHTSTSIPHSFNKTYNLQNDIQMNIVGGNPATLGEYPYQVALLKKEINYLIAIYQQFCGGSIIHENVILTAAHCVVDKKRIYVVAGIITLKIFNRKAQVRKSKKIIVHNKYVPFTKENDISIILLDNQLRYNIFIKPIPIARIPIGPDFNWSCVVTGWGITDLKYRSRPNKLHVVAVVLQKRVYCEDAYFAFRDGMLCGGGVIGQGFCFGDSGGPMACNNYLYGTVSFFLNSQCGNGGVHVYTDVYYYRDWITKSS